MRLFHLSIAILFLPPFLSAQSPAVPSVLVRYSFDDGLTETGPDTFRVFENSKGSVRLSRAYRWSGDSSVEITDAAGDGDFPELQGYFPAISKGQLYAHFALMTTTPSEEFNVALAGPEGFRLARNGIAFWLQGRGGALFQISDSIPKRILELESFRWYFLDVAYRVEEGTYDLVIRQEGGREPRATLLAQPNAASQPGSIVDKFSFVGDIEDDVSRVVYYVDDIVIGTDQAIQRLPFQAPGRRRLFVEGLTRDRSFLQGRFTCLPVSEPKDLDLTPSDLGELKKAGVLDLVDAIVSGRRPPARPWRTEDLSPRSRSLLEAALEWSEGCRFLQTGDARAALTKFESAESKSSARMYPISRALAQAAFGQFAEADERLSFCASAWSGDARYPLVLAMLGGARGDLARAEEWLRQPAGEALPESAAAASPEERCREPEKRMIAEQYFCLLLLNGFADLAAQYAERMVDRLSGSGALQTEWIEKRADAAFFEGDWETARRLYDQVSPQSSTALLKLADVYFQLGDLSRERSLRERIYGSLHAP